MTSYLIARLWDDTKITGSCWIFRGATNQNGYGVIRVNGKTLLVHRLSMHLHNNFDLDSKELILHKNECIARRCWNPEHLYIGNQGDNMKDRYDKPTCPHGHPWDEKNTHINKRGHKTCRECARIRRYTRFGRSVPEYGR